MNITEGSPPFSICASIVSGNITSGMNVMIGYEVINDTSKYNFYIQI